MPGPINRAFGSLVNPSDRVFASLWTDRDLMFHFPAWKIRTKILPSRNVVCGLVVVECPILLSGINPHQVNSAIARISFAAGMDNPREGDPGDCRVHLMW